MSNSCVCVFPCTVIETVRLTTPTPGALQVVTLADSGTLELVADSVTLPESDSVVRTVRGREPTAVSSASKSSTLAVRASVAVSALPSPSRSPTFTLLLLKEATVVAGVTGNSTSM